jgi:class 3 adenylate cyclase
MTEPANQPYPEERRLATVMFADVHGFTALADQLDFEDVSDLLREVWQLVDRVIESHGGYIDKHIGDAVMAVWGAPHAGEDDAERAVAAALTLLETLEEFALKSQNNLVRQLKMRVGVNTGQVLAGYVGARGEYTVLGDTVNIASRLETTADPGRVVIGENTYRLVRGLFRIHRLEPLQIKGKPNPVRAYQVEGALQRPSQVRYRSLGGLETCMVGRETEMSQLHSLYQVAVEARSPVLAIVRGEAGLGKSRLLMEFTSQLEVSVTNLLILASRSLVQAYRAPYFVWKLLWHQRFDISENDTPEIAGEKFIQGVKLIWGTRLGQVSAVEAAHVVGSLTGLDWPDSPYLAPLADDPAARASRAFELTRELLRRICAHGPTVLVLDDLHDADSGSLDLLEYLIEPAVDLPLLIVAATRPGILRKRRELHNAAQLISLKPLPIDPQLVAQAYPAIEDLPAATLSEIARVAEGNPYFMEEMVKSLTLSSAQGVTSTPENPQESGYYRLPDSLHATLQARLDSLSPAARNVALWASVVGRVFWVGAVAAAARQPIGTGLLGSAGALGPAGQDALQNQLAEGLAELVRAELAFPRAGSLFMGEQEYIFKHALVRDVAYSLLPHKHRRPYHVAVARWLAAFASPDFAGAIADHLEQGGAVPEAIQQYIRAANYARGRGAVDEAEWLDAHIRELGGTPTVAQSKSSTRPLPNTGMLIGGSGPGPFPA